MINTRKKTIINRVFTHIIFFQIELANSFNHNTILFLKYKVILYNI